MKQLFSREYVGTRSLMNPSREYVHSTGTDIRETFARVRAEQQLESMRPTGANVMRIRK